MNFINRLLLNIFFVFTFGSMAWASPQSSTVTNLNVFSLSSPQLNQLSNVKVVQLGEAIHMSRELPLARLPILRELNRFHGFDTILFEGSTIEAWLASDFLLSIKDFDSTHLTTARNISLPAIWRSDSLTEIFQAITTTWSTDHPLYFASYDFQPGMGKLKTQAIPEFFKALEKYHKPSDETLQTVKVLLSFSDRQSGFPNFETDFEKIEFGIQTLSKWVQDAEPKISAQFPNLPHGKTLLLIPMQLKRQLELWKTHLRDPEKSKYLSYQETRDRLAADAILDFTDQISPHHKVLVWAHHVHTFHNDLGKARHSLGSDLKRKLKNQLFTIGTFAGSGNCLSLNGEDFQESLFNSTIESGLEKVLSGLSKEDFFVDFRNGLSPELEQTLNTKMVSQIEGKSKLETIPLKDFDAAIFVHQVSAPKIEWN